MRCHPPNLAMPALQVIHAVAILNSGLEFSPVCPPAFAKLSRRCMSADADERPTFEEVVGQLHALQTQLLPTNQVCCAVSPWIHITHCIAQKYCFHSQSDCILVTPTRRLPSWYNLGFRV